MTSRRKERCVGASNGMEDLSKQQLILLTLLLSFVTSIATGIITVSLLNEAPQEVTQTINRVVEKTIERVVPVEIPGTSTTKEVEKITVIVKEEDLVIDSVEKNSKSIVRLKRTVGEGTDTFQGFGLIVNSNGLTVFPENAFVEGGTYQGVFFDGATTSISIASADTKNDLVYVQPSVFSSDPKKPYAFFPVTLSKAAPKLAQSVIVLSGVDTTSIATGRISTFGFTEVPVKEGEPKAKILSSIKTDITSKNEDLGSPLLNLSGEVMGIKSVFTESVYLPSSVLKTSLATSTPAAQ